MSDTFGKNTDQEFEPLPGFIEDCTPETWRMVGFIERRCPLLRPNTPPGWIDFRQDSTEWRSGIFVNAKDQKQMKALFGSQANCMDAKQQLLDIGIESEGGRSESRVGLWYVLWRTEKMPEKSTEWNELSKAAGMKDLRRDFWERCAVEAINVYFNEEAGPSVARMADELLKEWDARWGKS